MITPQEIRRRIQDALPGSQVEVVDLTGGGDHYRVTVIAQQFQDKGPVDRHRLVYAPFRDVLGGDLHALSLETSTPAEWEKKRQQQTGPGGLPSLPRL